MFVVGNSSNSSLENVIELDSSEDERETETINIADDSVKSSTLVHNPRQTGSNKKLKITVEDSPHKNQSSKITIELNSSQEFLESEVIMPVRNKRNSEIVSKYSSENLSLEFLQLIEYCLQLEYSEGMERIINKSLIPSYKKANKLYVESSEFQVFLAGIMEKMKKQSNLKFSFLKEVCEHLMLHKEKKRADLVTLSHSVTNMKRKSEVEKQTKKQNIEIIDLVEIEDAPRIVVDDEDDDVILIGEKNGQNNKNKFKNKKLKNPFSKEFPQKLELENAIKIKRLEERIENCKNNIKLFDEMEVTCDNTVSPYLMVDRFKAKLVELYKELCDLRGDSSYQQKPKIIRLKVAEGNPTGPAQRLQDWLLVNMKEGQEPPFPDFIDVIKCVVKANEEDGLNWTKAEVMFHARNLFTACGQALQKRRQKREWRDLRHLMGGDTSTDPADEDPLLLARLQENKRLCDRKEAGLLEHFSMLEADANQQRRRGSKSKESYAGKSTSPTIEYTYEVPIEFNENYPIIDVVLQDSEKKCHLDELANKDYAASVTTNESLDVTVNAPKKHTDEKKYVKIDALGDIANNKCEIVANEMNNFSTHNCALGSKESVDVNSNIALKNTQEVIVTNENKIINNNTEIITKDSLVSIESESSKDSANNTVIKPEIMWPSIDEEICINSSDDDDGDDSSTNSVAEDSDFEFNFEELDNLPMPISMIKNEMTNDVNITQENVNIPEEINGSTDKTEPVIEYFNNTRCIVIGNGTKDVIIKTERIETEIQSSYNQGASKLDNLEHIYIKNAEDCPIDNNETSNKFVKDNEGTILEPSDQTNVISETSDDTVKMLFEFVKNRQAGLAVRTTILGLDETTVDIEISSSEEEDLDESSESDLSEAEAE